MSFASETKKELVQIQSDDCCAKAEFSPYSNEWSYFIMK